MNILRRAQVVGGVVVATATVGAAAGVIVAAALMTTRLGHLRPQFLWEVVTLGSQTGATFGVVLGTPLTFALLRRAPFSRIGAESFAAGIYGGVIGYAPSLGFAQPRPSLGFMLARTCLGVGVAVVRLWARFREHQRASPMASGI